MLKRILWISSILIISGFFLSLAVLEFVDRDLFFQQEKKNKYLSETYIISHEIELLIKEYVLNIFNETKDYIDQPNNQDIHNILHSSTSLVSYLSIQNNKTSNIIISNPLIHSINYPCTDSFYSIPEKNILLTCYIYNKNKIYLGLSSSSLVDYLNKILMAKYSNITSSVIKNIILDRHNIYLNISQDLLIQERKIFNQAQYLLDIDHNFKVVLKGSPLFTQTINILGLDSKKYSYYMFYNPMIQTRDLLLKDILLILFFIFISLLIFILGLKDIFSSNFYHLDHFYLDKHITQEVINSFELETQDNNELIPPKRELTELRNLIREVIDQEKLSQDLSIKLSDEENKIDKNSWKTIPQKFTDIVYTLRCKEHTDIISIECISTTARDFEYTMPKNLFHIPKLLSEHTASYIYKEAGKTTPIKSLLKSSFINPFLVEGVMIIELSSDPYDYILHLFYDEIDHDLYQDIFEYTKKTFLIN